jgi:glycosyltransferase involved in cell wall biosynthesis
MRRGYVVVFLHRFPRNETRDLHISIRDKRLIHMRVGLFDWDAFQWEFGELLKGRPLVGLVESPFPEFVPLVRAIRRAKGKIVYELIDDWETSLGGRWYSSGVERRIIEQANAMAATAPSLARKLFQLTGAVVRTLPNGVDARLFDPTLAYSRPADLPASRPIFLYVGSMWGEWFDWKLLLRVAYAFPSASVTLLGDYRGECPAKLPNLHFLGLKRQTELPAYLAHADVGIIPWKRDCITAATSPLKVYEYLAMGLPVVSTALEGLPANPLVLRADREEDFITALAGAHLLSTDLGQVRTFREQNSWTARVDELERMVEPNCEEQL